jgi:hypothetical protein
MQSSKRRLYAVQDVGDVQPVEVGESGWRINASTAGFLTASVAASVPNASDIAIKK